MAKKLIPLAIAYDFDGTLAPGNMQERDFIPAIGMTTKAFWKEVSDQAKEHEADNILVYMGLMLEKARSNRVQVRKSDFEKYGKELSFFDGVLPWADDNGENYKGWFDRINTYGKESGVRVEHYIISSGIREMVQGSPIASKFKSIFASSFQYDHHGIATWPALALNYTTKTQYLFRINKGDLHVYDHKKINDFVPKSERPIPFENMVFIGDGETDIPCFRLVKDQGGHSIAVYAPNGRGKKQRAQTLKKDGRVDYVTAADYRDGGKLDQVIKGIIDKLSADHHLNSICRD
ncbi:MAG: HAD family hydrolase [Alphaproteobacteria bacterium]